jgi:hypothetical protein
MRIPWLLIIIITALALASFIGAYLAIEFAFGADVDGGCLTKAQAASRYPRQWLYWHSPSHCWDNRPGHRHSPDANGSLPQPIKRPLQAPEGPTIAYPSLMGGGGTDDSMMRPETMTLWPLIADFDEDPPAFIPWQQRIALEAK